MDEHERAQHIETILQLSERMVAQHIASDMRRERAMPLFSLPITMPQFKTLMLVTGSQGMTMGQLAKALGVGLPTVSGIVDRLYEQGLITRGEDPEDRRVTRVAPTARGRAIIETIYNRGRSQWLQMLGRLSEDELLTVERAFEILGNVILDGEEAEQ
ncbi:MAG: MarR family transcriptional regulator [Ktedonobacteraceae bacterium]|nr:MarR family transcriptional regulator [Ktedonobacteraceae bacterium]